MTISHTETLLVGNWRSENGQFVADEICERINRLITVHLQKIASDPSGWESLYRDPNDGRYWELTYPQSEFQGGGPPQLKAMSSEEARQKYGAGA